MFQHSPYRLTTTYQAVLAIFLGLGLSVPAYAMSLGRASVQSEQHQPLSATIPVSNINADNFSASVAPVAIYNQLGLDPLANVSVQFQKTSDTSGTLIIHSSSPVYTPFADIVLNLNNDGEQYIEPQTLLMPLPTSDNHAKNNGTTIVSDHPNPNLPVVNHLPVINNVPTSNNVAVPTDNQEQMAAYLDASEGDDTNALSHGDHSTINDHHAPMSTKIVSEEEQVISSLIPQGMNVQMDILTKQVTRRILSPSDLSQDLSQLDTTDTMPMHIKTDEHSESTIANEPAAEPSISPSEQQAGDATTTYIVQRGDNLWSISHQIAQANNMNTQDVMAALHAQNPNAFINNQANQLKANATLAIPNYQVVLSQKAIEEAISAKRQQSSKPTPAHIAKSATQSTKPTKQQTTETRTAIKPLPTAQVSLVAQTQSGQATGGQTKTTAGTGMGTSGRLIETLKDARTQTAQNAKRVNVLKQELSSATERLQLQNQQLAELEARLKALREK